MITSTLNYLSLYRNGNPVWNRAIDYVLLTNFDSMAAGTYVIEEDAIVVMVNEYITKTAIECEPERHRQNMDIQIMIEGEEKFGYTPFIDQRPTTNFLKDNDVAFYRIASSDLNFITLKPGQFIVFLPGDIHQPELLVHAPAPVKKVVVKVKTLDR